MPASMIMWKGAWGLLGIDRDAGHLVSRRGLELAEPLVSFKLVGAERQILDRYIAAAYASDAEAIAALLHDDVVLTMPPNPFWFVGREAMLAFLEPSFDPASPTYFGEWRLTPTTVNSMPASAN